MLCLVETPHSSGRIVAKLFCALVFNCSWNMICYLELLFRDQCRTVSLRF